MEKELFLILHNIRSAHNVGSIFRTADGLGVKKIYLTGYSPEPSGKEEVAYLSKAQKMLAKTALGAEESVNWERAEDILSLIKKLKEDGISVFSLETDKRAVDVDKAKIKFPSALILGNEAKGIDEKILKVSDGIFCIPMKGKKESFNVSVAAGIAIHSVLS